MRAHHIIAGFVLIALILFAVTAPAFHYAPPHQELMLILALLVAFAVLATLGDIMRGVHRLRIAWHSYRLRRSFIRLIKNLEPDQLEIMRDAAREHGLTIERIGAIFGVGMVEQRELSKDPGDRCPRCHAVRFVDAPKSKTCERCGLELDRELLEDYGPCPVCKGKTRLAPSGEVHLCDACGIVCEDHQLERIES